jgi:hypothetical protein
VIIELDGRLPRDPRTIDYSDITSAVLLGGVYTDEDGYALEFDRDLTPGEQRRVVRRATSSPTEQQILDKAMQAFAANKAFLALGQPTNAQVVQQVRLLTREVNALLRLVLGETDDASDV